MTRKIRTEADRRATPSNAVKGGVGQKVSRERGTHTRSKKSPGKRSHKGGS
jgi:hypothetical protein